MLYFFVFRVFTVFAVICTSKIFAKVSATNNINGFSVNLIHRDSPNSPLYNPLHTHAERVQNSFRRSLNRINTFRNQIKYPTSVIKLQDVPTIKLYTANGDYLMNITIASPPVQVLAVADTGSSMMWTQCLPCEHCYPQTLPIFEPNLSTTYELVECVSPTCAALAGSRNCDESRFCNYTMSYADDSFTKGFLATETFTLGPVSIPNLIFGCGMNNDGSFARDGDASGLIGLDSGPASLITQLGPSINGKFSYCLVPIAMFDDKHYSNIRFGTDALVAGDGVITTPMILKPKVLSAYFITILGFSIGTERFDITAPVTEGNIIVDSGSTLSFIPTDLFNKVEESLTRQTKKTKVDDPTKSYTLCYRSKDEIISPVLTLHFTGGDLVLESYNSYSRINGDTVCLAFVPNDDLSILGNLAQMNVHVGFDLQANTFSFKRAKCGLL